MSLAWQTTDRGVSLHLCRGRQRLQKYLTDAQADRTGEKKHACFIEFQTKSNYICNRLLYYKPLKLNFTLERQ